LSDSRLAPVWSALRAGGRTALIPYLTAGYPDRDASEAALRAADGVADILEVGVPFSDPLADGPTIQRSTFEALQRGMTLAGTLELVRRAELETPAVLFSYLNPLLAAGRDVLTRAADAGAHGVRDGSSSTSTAPHTSAVRGDPGCQPSSSRLGRTSVVGLGRPPRNRTG